MPNEFSSTLIKKSQVNNARIMKMTTPHGEVLTPAFMPVGTRAVLNYVSPYDLEKAHSQIILGGNTYHMLVAPGMEIIKAAGGMHKFMGWHKPMLTDSGGYQVLSLSKNGNICVIDDKGAHFKHPVTGQIIHLTPEISIQTQKIIGADIIMAFDECTPEQGDIKAQSSVGGCYYRGEGVTKDNAQAVVWFQKAAEQDDINAHHMLEILREENYPSAIRRLLRRAEEGDIEAQYQIAWEYESGVEIPRNVSKAFKWYQRAASKDVCEWYPESVRKVNANAQYNLGRCYADGLGVRQDDEKAFLWYLKVAEQGVSIAQRKVGEYYEKGICVKEDKNEAVAWYEKAAAQGDDTARIQLEALRKEGYEAPSLSPALFSLEFQAQLKLAKEGDAHAQAYIGYCYASGKEVKQDYDQAFIWYQKAALKRDADAQDSLGRCYQNGWGVKEDYTKAVAWYLKAAEQGSAGAQNNLGLCYEEGTGVKQDKNEAAVWYEKAAAQGNEYARTRLEELKKEGNKTLSSTGALSSPASSEAKEHTATTSSTSGLLFTSDEHSPIEVLLAEHKEIELMLGKSSCESKEMSTEFERCLKLANEGDAQAQAYVGYCYGNGDGVKQDDEEAFKWFQKAADQGNANAQNSLGLCYQYGWGVEQTDDQAFEWFKKAADQGNADAQNKLGWCYQNGRGVKQNYDQAFEWFQKAAEQERTSPEFQSQLKLATEGDAQAQFYIGDYYLNRTDPFLHSKEEVNQNQAQEFAWNRKAAIQGHARAQYNIGCCYLYGRGVKINYDQMFEWSKKAAEQGDGGGQFLVGMCYEQGWGVKQDDAHATEWYKKAAEKGYDPALRKLGYTHEKFEALKKKEYKASSPIAAPSSQDSEKVKEHKSSVVSALPTNVPLTVEKKDEFSVATETKLPIKTLPLVPPPIPPKPTKWKIKEVSASPPALSLPPKIEEKAIAEREKIWHFDTALKPALGEIKGGYVLIDAGVKDTQKVVVAYQQGPVPGYDVRSVKIIYNPALNRSFANKFELLQAKDSSSAFAPQWSSENENVWRGTLIKRFEEMAAPYHDKEYPAVKLFAGWHGTKPEILSSIFKIGFANLASTDEGFFGKGLYSAYEPQYAYGVYSQGALLVNWVVCYSIYPVIKGDRAKLEGRANYQNYDAHMAAVVPDNPSDPHTNIYLPCAPQQPAKYHEIVVFDPAQCLPRYLVELQPSLPKAPSVIGSSPVKISSTFFAGSAAKAKLAIQKKEQQKAPAKTAVSPAG
jgi:TPR repeat protein